MNSMSMEKDESSSMVSSVPSNQPLEQFVLLAKGAKGSACGELIKQVLDAPGIHVFGELLEMPNIIELENSPFDSHFKTLNLFAYGTYKEYLQNKSDYLELTPTQTKKLQHLTIVALATREKCIPYDVLLEELNINNVRDLEDLIIEAIYSDIIHGKLDQKHKRLEVDYALGRDAKPGDAAAIADILAEWCAACEQVLSCVDEQILRANNDKQKTLKHKDAIEQEFKMVKKMLKSQAEGEESGGGGGGTSGSEPLTERAKKTTGKTKSTRYTSKFWQKAT